MAADIGSYITLPPSTRMCRLIVQFNAGDTAADNVTVFVKYLATRTGPALFCCVDVTTLHQLRPIPESLRRLLRRGATYRSSLATSHSTLHDLPFHVTILNSCPLSSSAVCSILNRTCRSAVVIRHPAKRSILSVVLCPRWLCDRRLCTA